MHHGCETWRKFDISFDRVIEMNSKIGDSSTELWEYVRNELEQCRDEGLL